MFVFRFSITLLFVCHISFWSRLNRFTFWKTYLCSFFILLTSEGSIFFYRISLFTIMSHTYCFPCRCFHIIFISCCLKNVLLFEGQPHFLHGVINHLLASYTWKMWTCILCLQFKVAMLGTIYKNLWSYSLLGPEIKQLIRSRHSFVTGSERSLYYSFQSL